MAKENDMFGIGLKKEPVQAPEAPVKPEVPASPAVPSEPAEPEREDSEKEPELADENQKEEE